MDEWQIRCCKPHSGYNLTEKEGDVGRITMLYVQYAGRDMPCVASLMNVPRSNMRFTRSGYSSNCGTSLRGKTYSRARVSNPLISCTLSFFDFSLFLTPLNVTLSVSSLNKGIHASSVSQTWRWDFSCIGVEMEPLKFSLEMGN